jgi:hypothetical protein
MVEEEVLQNLDTFEYLDALIVLFDQKPDPMIQLGA